MLLGPFIRNAMGSGLATAVIGAVALTTAGTADAATYTGTLTSVPGSEISLTFKREDGRLYLDQYSWGQAPWVCDNGTDSVGMSGGYNPPDGLVSRGGFRIHLSAPENDFVGLLGGEFNRTRTRLSGAVRYRGRHHDPSYGVCDTGKLEWRATRQAP